MVQGMQDVNSVLISKQRVAIRYSSEITYFSNAMKSTYVTQSCDDSLLRPHTCSIHCSGRHQPLDIIVAHPV